MSAQDYSPLKKMKFAKVPVRPVELKAGFLEEKRASVLLSDLPSPSALKKNEEG